MPMDELTDYASDPDLPPHLAKPIRDVAVALARAFLAGEASPAAMRSRGEHVLGRPWPWLVRLALRLHFEFGPEHGTTHETAWRPELHDRIVDSIVAFADLRTAFEQPGEKPRVRSLFPFHAAMGSPPPALQARGLPALATPGDLADWLGISPTELDWYANTASWVSTERVQKLHHYHYRWIAKPRGGVRLIEAPKKELRSIQRQILSGILDRVPVHDAAHGCVRGRSAVSNSRLHCASPLLLKMDLRDFFASIPGGRVHALFLTLGYPLETARYLTGLTTHRTPARVLGDVPQEEYASPEERRDRRRWGMRFSSPHLPQGAPTSPALANLCAYRLDIRLAGAARACGANYSRYVDDLAFSCTDGDIAHGRRILAMAQEIIREEGFDPNWRKTVMAPASTSQRITGFVVNRRINLPRAEYDTLKAILTNCRRHGPASQNRRGVPDFRAHLLGRISRFAEVNVERGQRLRLLFDRIAWQ